MTMVWVAFLMVTGVMFGMASLAIDLGYGMLQVRAMQNGADAGVMAAAKLLAGSVVDDGAGGIIFTVPNGTVQGLARQFAFYNQPAGLTSSNYEHIAVQYLPCPTLTAGSPNFTAESDLGIVSEVGGSRQASTAVLVPTWTCSLRVYAKVTYNALFGGVIGQPDQASTGRASARVFPAEPPTEFTNVWPITRWTCNGTDNPATTNKDEGNSIDDVPSATDGVDECDDDEPICTVDPLNPEPCNFWSSQAKPGHSGYKNYLDMSRFSDLAKKESITREQHLDGWAAGCAASGPSYCPVEFDPTRPGTNDKTDDVPYWVEHGWKGSLIADKSDCVNVVNKVFADATEVTNVTDPTKCKNSRIEKMNGNLGANIGTAIKKYIDGHKEGNSEALCKFAGANNPDNDYAVVTVVVWRWGEQDTANGNDSIALNDQSKLWGYYQSNAGALGITNQEGDLQRVIVQRASFFRFCRGWVGGSDVRGYFVSYTDFKKPPKCPVEPCKPSPVANTVSLVE